MSVHRDGDDDDDGGRDMNGGGPDEQTVGTGADSAFSSGGDHDEEHEEVR